MIRFRRTTLITVGCLSLLAGLGLARLVNLQFQVWWLAFFSLLLLIRRKNVTGLILIVFLGLILGLWRGGIYMQKLDELKQFSGQQVTISATATSDSVYANRSQIEFTANHAFLVTGLTYHKQLAGSFKISGFGAPMIYRGDHVQITGKLFPMRGSNQARIAYAQLERTGRDSSWVNNFTRRFSAGMQSALPEPNASFGLGLIIGQRNTLPQQLTNQLIMVGLVHIVAVSGYNLTILVRAIGRLRLGSKYQRLVVSLALIGVFILMTGFSASIVRAAIISVLSLWAWYYGRKMRPLLLISFAAALTAFINPFYIWGDMSWYLSFLAFFGVLMIAPLAARKLFRRRPKMLGMVILETLSAEIMTLPLIVMNFNQLSLIGLLANVLVVPLIPLAMLLSAVAAGAGMLIPAIAGWLAWPANLLLTYILDVVKTLSGIPGIFLHRSISTVSMLVLYASALLAVIIAHKREGPATPKSAGLSRVNPTYHAGQ